MRLIGRAIGWALVILGLVALARDLWRWVSGPGPLHFARLGEIWVEVDRQGLAETEAEVQRSLLARIWDWVVQPVLTGPAAFVVLLAVGLLLLLFIRPRRKRWLTR